MHSENKLSVKKLSHSNSSHEYYHVAIIDIVKSYFDFFFIYFYSVDL